MGFDQLELFKPIKSLHIFTTQNFLITIYIISTAVFGTFFWLQLVH